MSTGHRSGSDRYPPLRLYIAGGSPAARRALDSRRRLIQTLGGGIEIHIVDILASPEEAEKAGILATPTLSDDSITPPRRLIGDLSNITEVLSYFGYPKKDVSA